LALLGMNPMTAGIAALIVSGVSVKKLCDFALERGKTKQIEKALDMGTLADSVSFTLPVQLKRRGLERRLILPSGDSSPPPKETVAGLQRSLVRALSWHQTLITGEAKSAAELAEREGINPRNAARHLQMAYLAPDIVQAILDGDVPSECSFDRIKEDLPAAYSMRARTKKKPPQEGERRPKCNRKSLGWRASTCQRSQ